MAQGVVDASKGIRNMREQQIVAAEHGEDERELERTQHAMWTS